MARISRRKSHRISFAAAMALGVAAVDRASADLYWDANGDVAGASVAPSGTWGVDNFWSVSSAGTFARRITYLLIDVGTLARVNSSEHKQRK